MADGNEGLVVLQVIGTQAIRIDAGDIGDVVTLLLEEVDGSVICAVKVVVCASIGSHAVARHERAVITDGIGPVRSIRAGARNRIMIHQSGRVAVKVRGAIRGAETARPAVVRLPSRIRRLEHDVRIKAVVPDDERNLVGLTRDRITVAVEHLQAGDINA